MPEPLKCKYCGSTDFVVESLLQDHERDHEKYMEVRSGND